jgi:hypothetical protein
MEGIGKGLATVFIWACIICGILGIAIATTVYKLLDDDSIRTHHRLTPRLELVIDSGRVDTMYVYKVEKK